MEVIWVYCVLKYDIRTVLNIVLCIPHNKQINSCFIISSGINKVFSDSYSDPVFVTTEINTINV